MSIPNKFLYFSTTEKFNAQISNIENNSISFIADSGKVFVKTVDNTGKSYNSFFGGNDSIYAVKDHASTDTTFGGGTASKYGHVKLSDAYSTNAGAASASIAASGKAIYDAYTTLSGLIAPKLSAADFNTTFNNNSVVNSGAAKNINFFKTILGVDASVAGTLSVSAAQTNIVDSTHRFVTDDQIVAWNSKTTNTGTVRSVTAGKGLTGGISEGESAGTISANVKDSSAYSSGATSGTSGKIYAVNVDKNGYLAVDVPWENTTYTHPSTTIGAINLGTTAKKFVRTLTTDASGHVTGAALDTIVAGDLPTASTSGKGITQLKDAVDSSANNMAATPNSVKTAYDKAVDAYNLADSKTSNLGTVRSVTAGVGLAGGISDGQSTGTVKAKLQSETSIGQIGKSQIYAIGVDSSGYLAVSVPWSDTKYTHPGTTAGAINLASTATKFVKTMTTDASGHVTGAALDTINSADLPAASTSAQGAVKLSDSTSTTSSSVAATSTAVKSAMDRANSAYELANGKTSNLGTVRSVTAGKGLTGGISDGESSGTVSAKIKESTAYSKSATAGASSQIYAINVDKDGYLAVDVPWSDTKYVHPVTTVGAINLASTATKFVKTMTTDASGHVTGAALDTINSNDLPAATTSAQGAVKLSDSTTTTSSSVAATSTAVKSAMDRANSAYELANSKTSNLGTVRSVTAGIGLAGGISDGESSGTIKAKVHSETQKSAKATESSSSQLYAVSVDASGCLSCAVPWTDTTENQTITLSGDITGSGKTSIATVIGNGKVTNAMLAGNIENGKIKSYSTSSNNIKADDIHIPSAGAVYSYVNGFSSVNTAAGTVTINGNTVGSNAAKIGYASHADSADIATNATTATTATNNVLKAGDTMTGTLKVDAQNITPIDVTMPTGLGSWSANMYPALYVKSPISETNFTGGGIFFGYDNNIGSLTDGWLIGHSNFNNPEVEIESPFYIGKYTTKNGWIGTLALGEHWAAVGGRFIPAYTNIYDLGNPALKWNNVYANNVIADLTGTATNAINAANSAYTEKIGTSASHPSIGTSTKPVYVNADGVITAGTYTLGSACEKTAGSAVGNVPLIGTALPSAKDRIVLTDANGKLAPSNSTVGDAAFKGVDTTVTAGSSNLITSGGVSTAISDLAKALKYEGVVSADGSLGTATKGKVYFAAANFTLSASKSSTGSAVTVEKGDMIVGNGSKYDVVQANWTATDGSSALAWNTDVTLATIGGVTINAKLPANPIDSLPYNTYATKFYKNSISATSGTQTLLPNQMYVFDSSLNGATTFNQGAQISGIVNEYSGRFKTGSSVPTITFTNVSIWNEDRPDIEPNSTYEFSIIDNYGILTKLATYSA